MTKWQCLVALIGTVAVCASTGGHVLAAPAPPRPKFGYSILDPIPVTPAAAKRVRKRIVVDQNQSSGLDPAPDLVIRQKAFLEEAARLRAEIRDPEEYRAKYSNLKRKRLGDH